MQIKTDELAEGHTEFEGQSTPESPSHSELSLKNPISVRAQADRIGEQIRVAFFYAGQVELQCARCVERFTFPVDGKGSLVFSEGRLVVADDEGNEDDVSEYYDKELETIDLDAVLYDDIMTAIPMKPLCSEGCSGIEGKEAPSDEMSAGQEIDPRWAALEKLRKKRSSE